MVCRSAQSLCHTEVDRVVVVGQDSVVHIGIEIAMDIIVVEVIGSAGRLHHPQFYLCRASMSWMSIIFTLSQVLSAMNRARSSA